MGSTMGVQSSLSKMNGGLVLIIMLSLTSPNSKRTIATPRATRGMKQKGQTTQQNGINKQNHSFFVGLWSQ